MATSFGAIGIPARGETLADAIVPGRDRSLVRGAALAIGGAALTAASAQLAFHVPWTPVPYTGQTAAVLLVGTALGWRLGAISMLLYVAAGAVGLPVYSAGAGGLDQLLGYTGGYLVAFVVAAAAVGALAQRGWDRSPRAAGMLMVAGNLLIYGIGVPVLAVSLAMPLGDAVWNGALVFLPWDALKVLLAAGLLPAAWRLLRTGR
jgi:biotin transport system substrate-specific component